MNKSQREKLIELICPADAVFECVCCDDCESLLNFYLDRYDADVRAEGESIGITRVLDILEHLDKQMLQKVKDALYEQDYKELKEQENEFKAESKKV